jgi:undecaprenyl-diphosphatase
VTVVGRMIPLDRHLFRLMNDAWTNSALDLFMPFLSGVANDGLLWLAVLAVIAVLGGKVGRWAALAGLVALGVGAATSDILKELTAQARPFLVLSDVHLAIDPPDSYSFPSGHATSAFATSSGVIFTHRRLLGRVPHWDWGLLALAGAVAYSRVYVGVHYPSDVLVGVVLGTFIGWTVATTIAWRSRKPRGARLSASTRRNSGRRDGATH